MYGVKKHTIPVHKTALTKEFYYELAHSIAFVEAQFCCRLKMGLSAQLPHKNSEKTNDRLCKLEKSNISMIKMHFKKFQTEV
jgi:hypothetical protein